jgi:hypothetical protein
MESAMVKGDGWRYFAGTILGLAGIMRLFDAIWAWTYNGAVANNLQDALFGHSLTTYGWVYFVVGVVLLGCSVGVVAGSDFSRWIGIAAGALLAISAIWWMPYYPIWSLTYIALGVLVVYALAAYGGSAALAESDRAATAADRGYAGTGPM